MRIAVLCDRRIVNSLYRASIPFGALQERGHDVRWDGNKGASFDVEMLAGCDLVFVHRHFDRDMQRLAGALRDRGVALWWDNDDDILAVPKGAPGYESVGGLRGKQIFAGMVKMMQAADVVTTPSAVLADKYRGHGAAVVTVLENYLPNGAVVGRSRRRREGPVIGWIGGLEHQIDVEALGIASALDRVCGRHRGARVVSVGVKLSMDAPYEHIPGVAFSRLSEVAAGFDVGIAPLADIALNRSRSNVKLKEYAAAGTPWLASAMGPYVGMGEREGGRLVADDGWAEAVERLLSSRWERGRLARRAAKWAHSQTIGANVEAWEQVARDAVDRARVRRTAGARRHVRPAAGS
ncbi:glycosyltransferase [Conexibacter arvalis]|uniref:Glycosyltransferase involved in cell wall biosynthesis n=1 Tax=Conexibacter arvalis TaxID=912552 RepID=A0A840IHS4_9ACTN|nr:glycosyltransferase [Conexibacter arvalis]MBB4664329.1 glycosyltransferase involved in cell wall biosynthesis [Conexibacter arvalis]